LSLSSQLELIGFWIDFIRKISRERLRVTVIQQIVHDLWALRLERLAFRLEVDPLSDSESQMFSSQGSEAATGSSTDDTMSSRLVQKSSTPNLFQTLSLCFFGIHLLRLPITLGDFLKWIKQGDLLYYRAIKSVPKRMIDRLPGQYHPFLDPQDILQPRKLHHAVTGAIVQYQKDMKMWIPPLNLTLHLYRYIEELSLPIGVFPAVKRIGTLASFDFKYPEQKGKILRIVDFPDGQLAAAIILAVKMLYPFDSIKRYPLNSGDLTGAVVNWDAWEEARKSYENQIQGGNDERLNYEDAMQVTESDVLTMSDTKIDDYLEYFTKNWTINDPEDKDKDVDYRRAMLDLFPVTQPPSSQVRPVNTSSLRSERIKTVIATLVPRRVITEDQEEESGKKFHRPGALYKRYRRETDLEGHARTFYQAVADLAGLPLRSIVRAVYVTEGQLFRTKEEEELRKQFTTRREGKGKQKADDEMIAD
jgi:RNA polymerase I-specific transcription initiation factor RRN7